MSKDVLTLEQRVYYECVDMADYAYSAGFQVPGTILQSLNELANYFPTCPETEGSGYKVVPETKEVKAGSPPEFTMDLAKKMSNIHNKLSEIVAPARPGTLFLFAQERRKFKSWYIWGPVPLIRYMVFLAILSLVTFIALGVALSNYFPNIANLSMFELKGFALILNLVFLLTAASLGSLFAALFKANKYVSNNTFDMKYENSYWIRYILGLMAGLIISQLIPLDFGNSASGVNNVANSLKSLAKPTLALLAGFSADLVYRILSQLVEAAASIMKGSASDVIESHEELLKLRTGVKNIENQMYLASKLAKLNQQIDAAQKPEKIREQINEILKTLLPDEEDV